MIGDFLRASGKHVAKSGINKVAKHASKINKALSPYAIAKRNEQVRLKAERAALRKQRSEAAKDARNQKRYDAAAKKTARTGRNHFKFVNYE